VLELINIKRKMPVTVESNTASMQGLLVHEMQHRMKNYLQLILSLINTQMDESGKEKADDFLENLKDRILVLAAINDQFDYTSDNRELALDQFIDTLITKVSTSFRVSENSPFITRKLEKVFVRNNVAVPIGLIVTELIINAYKYAFPKELGNNFFRAGQINVCLRKRQGKLIIEVADNGISMDASTSAKGMSKGKGLITALAEQIDANIVVICNKGTKYQIELNA
jgi:two-component system, sensor histidine kinase PdtaS